MKDELISAREAKIKILKQHTVPKCNLLLILKQQHFKP